MKRLQKVLLAAAVLMVATLFACVTINIYFPAEKIESVAGDIVNDIRGRKPSQKDNQSKNQEGFFQGIMVALSPASAWAEDVTTISNPTIRAMKEKMKARFQQLKAFYHKGILNDGSDGYLSVKSTGGLNLKAKRDLKGLVDAENSDRKTLYAEVAKALNIDPGQISRISEIFAKEWQKPVR